MGSSGLDQDAVQGVSDSSQCQDFWWFMLIWMFVSFLTLLLSSSACVFLSCLFPMRVVFEQGLLSFALDEKETHGFCEALTIGSFRALLVQFAVKLIGFFSFFFFFLLIVRMTLAVTILSHIIPRTTVMILFLSYIEL